jgi:hypothetical protein
VFVYVCLCVCLYVCFGGGGYRDVHLEARVLLEDSADLERQPCTPKVYNACLHTGALFINKRGIFANLCCFTTD